MNHNLRDDLEAKRTSKISPCSRYERFDRTSENIIGVGTTYGAMDTEEGIEVLWAEISILEGNETAVRAHFDTLLRFRHLNLLRVHAYWIENHDGNLRLFFICDFVCNTLLTFIKRSQLNNKPIPLKTQVRILKQILFALAYLNQQNPQFNIPLISNRSVFMTHDGAIKISPLIPNKHAQVVILGKDLGNLIPTDEYYDTLVNFCKILCSMACPGFCADDDLSKILDAPDLLGLVPAHVQLIGNIHRNKSIRISDIFKSDLLYSFPTLKYMAASCLLKAGIDINDYSLEFSSEDVFLTYVEKDKKLLYSEIPQVDIQRFLAEVKTGLHYFSNLQSGEFVKSSSFESPPVKHREVPEPVNTNPNPVVIPEEIPIPTDYGPVAIIKCNILPELSLKPPCKKIQICILYHGMFCRVIERDINPNAESATVVIEEIISEGILAEKYRNYLDHVVSHVFQGEELTLVLNDTF